MHNHHVRFIVATNYNNAPRRLVKTALSHGESSANEVVSMVLLLVCCDVELLHPLFLNDHPHLRQQSRMVPLVD